MEDQDNIFLEYEYVHCALCGQDNTHVKFQADPKNVRLSRLWIKGTPVRVHQLETIVTCNHCGLVYVNPRIKEKAEIASYSTAEEIAYFETTYLARKKAYLNLLNKIPGWLGKRPETLLDIGCGDGVLLEAARSLGIQGSGLEVSGSLIELVQKRLGDEIVYHPDRAPSLTGRYDVVALINVIEHLRNPFEQLKEAFHYLRPGGLLIVHTININGLPAKMRGVHWHQIEPYSHFYYFKWKTLKDLLLKTGYQPMARFNLSIHGGAKHLVQSTLEKMGIFLDSGLGVVARCTSENA